MPELGAEWWTDWWTQWWTYSLRDLLLFSPRTYWRLFELYNIEAWPAQIAALGVGVAMPILWCRDHPGSRRLAAAMLAACWFWVAWAFHWQRYAAINWAASGFAGVFAVEAFLLLWLGVVRDRLRVATTRLWRRGGLSIAVFALIGYPLLGPLLGRDWTQMEVFGMAPDPTVLATLGILLLAGGRASWALIPIPLAWCAISSATLWAMSAR